MTRGFCLLMIGCFSISILFGQSAKVTAVVSDDKQNTAVPFPNAILKGKSFHKSTSDKDGNIVFENVPYGNYYLVIQENGFFEFSKNIEIKEAQVNLGAITIEGIDQIKVNQDNIPTVINNDEESSSSGSSAVVSSLLTAARDPFISGSSFQLSAARFRNRGYDGDDNILMLNGAPLNNLERGEASFSEISGLNDVLRARDNNYGLEASTFTFGDIGSATNIEAMAAKQRKGYRFSYAMTNRSYRNRLMATYSSGLTAKKWAFTISGSRRYAEEGYFAGTFYDSWGLYTSISKKFGDDHTLSIAGFGLKTVRGTNADATAEMYELYGNHYYNSGWGFQNDVKRSARTRKEFTPSVILTHEWNPNAHSNLLSAFSFQTGSKARGGLDWFNALSPAPDYYRKLPSYQTDPVIAQGVRDYLISNPAALQQDWARMYEANRNNFDSVYDVGGVVGNNVGGKWSRYVLSDQVDDNKEYAFNTVYNNQVNDIVAITAGAMGQKSMVTSYRRLEDLMGGDYYVNANQFRIGQSSDSLLAQNNADNPNQIIREGDEYGYKYIANTQKASAFLQSVFVFKHIDFFFAGKFSYTEVWREGLYRNGAFLNNSLGKSEVVEFRNYGGKGGITYKLNGKNYFFANGIYETRAPYYNNVLVSTRTRNAVVKDPTSTEIISVEGGYILRDANWKGRLVGFYTTTKDEITTTNLFNDITNEMTTMILKGINKEYKGIELGVEGKLYKGWKVLIAASVGDYTYTNRPTMYFLNDNNENPITEDTVYFKGLHLASGPQNAGTLGFQYNSTAFWRAGINFNYFDKIYVDPSANRRNKFALDLVEKGSDQYNKILTQEHLPSAWTIDLNFSKSFYLNRAYPKLKKKIYIDVSANVNNVLDHQNFIMSGREQLRFDDTKNDPNKFSNRYSYMQGRTYFINIALRM
ncbi:MAG: TonB-dependent receptor [Bacteroidetes bacterium]|nr:TonB-dependent receptor [Bacteroidota bacterium]